MIPEFGLSKGARLFALVSFPHLRTELLKTVVSVIGMALGIAVYFAIRTALWNSWQSFVTSTQLLFPKDQVCLEGKGGEINEQIIPQVLALPGLEHLEPQSSRFVEARAGDSSLSTVQVLGVDTIGTQHKNSSLSSAPLLKDPHAIFVSPEIARKASRNSLALVVNGVVREFTIGGEIPFSRLNEVFGNQVVLIDIAYFQDIFGSWGKVDQLCLSFSRQQSRSDIEENLRSLSPNISLSSPDENARHAQKMSESFRLNLIFLAAISLFVALFLVYNTTSYSVLKRRHDLAILRSLGASSRQLFVFLSLESIVLGLLSALLGVVLGYFFALTAVKIVSSSFSTLYLPVQVKKVHWRTDLLIQCLFLGPMLSFLGGLIPVSEIIRRPPRHALASRDGEESFQRWLPLLFFFGLFLFGCAFVTSQEDLLKKSIYMGFLPPSFLLVGIVFIVPFLLFFGVKAARAIAIAGSRPELLLAVDHISASLRRSSMATSAITVATGMFVGISIMILSFRHTVNDWIEHVTKADIYVSANSHLSGPTQGYLPNEVINSLQQLPEVEDFDWISTAKITIDNRQVRVNGVRFETITRHHRLLFKLPMTDAELDNLFVDTQQVLVSETFANRTQLKVGDTFILPGLHTGQKMQIGNIFYDYSSDQGVILIQDRVFERIFSNSQKHAISLYLHKDVDPEIVCQKIRQMFATYTLVIRSNKTLRTEVLKVFDDTFRITYALQGIALLISVLTLLNTVLMLMLDRTREFAVLRAIGASVSSLALMVAYETLLLGIFAVIAAFVLGFSLAGVLVFVVNKFFFGWSIRFLFPTEIFFTTSVTLIALAVLTGLIPGFFAAKRIPSTALNYE